MSTVPDNIKKNRIKSGLTQSDLGKLLGRAPSVIANWEAGTNRPDVDSIAKMLEIFKIDANAMFGWEDADIPLEAWAKAHMNKYIDLDDHGRDAVDAILNCELDRTLREQNRKAKNPDNVITLVRAQPEEIEKYQKSDLVVPYQTYGAGSQVDTGEKSSEVVTVMLTPEIRKADFAVQVIGDSMEPTYPDGCSVAVMATKDLYPGDVGLFVIDGEHLIKKMGQGVLLSLNPEYDPIQLTEFMSIETIGKVLGVVELE